MGLRFLGTGAALPQKVLTNSDLEKIVETSDAWITERTGIKERRVAAEDEATSDLALQAAREAIANANITPQDIDLIIVATCTPDHFFPSVACLVQRGLGIPRAVAFDVSAACSGFIYGLAAAAGMLRAGTAKRALLIGADTLTKFTDWKDRGTCVLFGDGAGALVLESAAGTDNLLAVALGADGSGADILNVPGGGSRHPFGTNGNAQHHPPFIRMEGREVFKHAVVRMAEAATEALAKAGLSINDISLVIPHQANLRIIDAVAKRLNLPEDKVFRNVQKYGNMSAATTIIALDEARRSGRLKPGDKVELIAFGAGLTWAAAVLQW